MKKLLAVALPAGLIVILVLVLGSRARQAAESGLALDERARLKRDFAERSALARAMPPERAAEWRDEVQALSRWYFDEVAAIRNRHPAARPPEKPERKGKAPSDKERALASEFQQYADGRLALLRGGSYAPRLSAVDQGLRLDLLAVEPGASPEGGGPGLRIDFALWGAPRYLERERDRERVTTRSVVPVVLKRIAFRFLDAKGKQYGEMNGPGEPYLKLADPERFSEDFPPAVLFGTWWVELFPTEAVTVEIEVEAGARGASGTERPLLFKIAAPVPEGWRIAPGAKYEAQVREAVAQ